MIRNILNRLLTDTTDTGAEYYNEEARMFAQYDREKRRRELEEVERTDRILRKYQPAPDHSDGVAWALFVVLAAVAVGFFWTGMVRF